MGRFTTIPPRDLSPLGGPIIALKTGLTSLLDSSNMAAVNQAALQAERLASLEERLSAGALAQERQPRDTSLRISVGAPERSRVGRV
jgi:hypothetical protein